MPEPPAAAPLAELSGGYGLLAGSDDTPLAPRHPPADAALPGVPPTRPMTPPTRGSHRRAPEPLPAGWVLILAASLGLAVGSVIGLLTLL